MIDLYTDNGDICILFNIHYHFLITDLWWLLIYLRYPADLWQLAGWWIEVYIQQGEASSVLGNCLDAVRPSDCANVHAWDISDTYRHTQAHFYTLYLDYYTCTGLSWTILHVYARRKAKQTSLPSSFGKLSTGNRSEPTRHRSESWGVVIPMN